MPFLLGGSFGDLSRLWHEAKSNTGQRTVRGSLPWPGWRTGPDTNRARLPWVGPRAARGACVFLAWYPSVNWACKGGAQFSVPAWRKPKARQEMPDAGPVRLACDQRQVGQPELFWARDTTLPRNPGLGSRPEHAYTKGSPCQGSYSSWDTKSRKFRIPASN